MDSSSRAAATLVGIIVASLSVGYWVGRTIPTRKPEHPSEYQYKAEVIAHAGSDIEEDSKLVLVVRTDLGMSVGKIAAQCSHATLACYKASNPALIRRWERTGQTKVALRCTNEDELLLLQAQAESLSLCARSIQDAGRTQIATGSRTVLGIGPGPSRLINQVSGKLRLL